jgi:ParB-like chromosome segregation protein Spo0J
MSNIIHIYKAVKEASQNEALAQAIAEAFDEADSRYPNLATTAIQRDLSETELRLMSEIEKTRGEIKDSELKLTAEIKETELRIVSLVKETELKLTKEIGKHTTKTIVFLSTIMGLFYAIIRFVPVQ